MYIEKLEERRKLVPSLEVTVAEIKSVLFGVFGIKEESIESQVSKMPIARSTVTNEMMQAWNDAGMPSPPQKFFHNWKLKHG